METITNAASTAATTVSNLIYGQQTKNNETGGNEPLSGQQGKGTANDPFDQGNAENPVGTSSSTNTFPGTSKNESAGKEPISGQRDTEEFGHGDAAKPADASSKSDTSSAPQTGITDKDGIKPPGAPGDGPPAPHFTPATPETYQGSSTPNKEPMDHKAEATKDSTMTETRDRSSIANKESVSHKVDAVLNPPSKAEKAIDDREVDNSHSKMANRTVRHIDASKPAAGGEARSLVAENFGHKPESSKPPELTSPTGGDEKSDDKSGKMSNLKDKLKDKLHIGSKDK